MQEPLNIEESLSAVSSHTRFSTHSHELDSVLGGGLTRNSVVLISGEPGIGKVNIIITSCFLCKKIR